MPEGIQCAVQQLNSWLDKTQPHITPQSTLGKAISYLSNNWSRLIRYLEGGHRCHRGAERIASRI